MEPTENDPWDGPLPEDHPSLQEQWNKYYGGAAYWHVQNEYSKYRAEQLVVKAKRDAARRKKEQQDWKDRQAKGGKWRRQVSPWMPPQVPKNDPSHPDQGGGWDEDGNYWFPPS